MAAIAQAESARLVKKVIMVTPKKGKQEVIDGRCGVWGYGVGAAAFVSLSNDEKSTVWLLA